MIKAKITESPLQVWKDGVRQKNPDGSWAESPAYRVDGYENGIISVQNLTIYENKPTQKEIDELERKWNDPKWQEESSGERFLNSILPRKLR